MTLSDIGAGTPPASGSAGDARPLSLEVRSLEKAFGATQALRGCTLRLRPGEIHALVGENGSGKSTLVKILAGIHAPDAGEVVVGSALRTRDRGPRQALERSVATVFQEVLVVESRSVVENVWLGHDGLLRPRLSRAEKRRRAGEVLSRLLADPPRLDRPVDSLSLSDRQACSIARALVREPDVLLLDEATSALDFDTRTRLFIELTKMRARGAAVVLITHRMDEIDEIADRVTVMRSGTTVAEMARGEWDRETLVRLMTGAEQLTGEAREERHSSPRPPARPLVTVEGLQLVPGGEPIDVVIHAGELVGVAGLEGHGQDRFVRMLAGLRRPGGVIRKDGTAVASQRHAASLRIAYVPRERRAEGLFERLSVLENFAQPTLHADTRAGLISRGRTTSRFRPWADALKIKLGTPGDLITTLSGGNQQKVVIARWLATRPQLLILNDPTRGIDINAKRDLYAVLADLVAEGTAVVMLSTEVDEHIELMDRVLVFRENRLETVHERTGLTREVLVASFFGKREDADV